MSRVIANWVLFWLDCGHLVRNSLSTSWRSCENICILLQNESSFSNACILTCVDSKKKIEKRKKGKCGDSLASNVLSQRFSNYRVSFVTIHLILITLFCFRILKTFKSPLQRFIWQNNARCFAFPARNE